MGTELYCKSILKQDYILPILR